MIVVNLEKAKDIAHDKRRLAREEEFKPFDAVISKQIPGVDFVEAEAQRQVIREKYAEIQSEINAASDVGTLSTLVNSFTN